MAKRQKGTMFPRPNRGQVSNKKLRWVSIVAGFFAVSAVIAGTGAVVWYVTTGRTTTADPNAGLTVGGPTNLNAGLTVSSGTTTLSSLAASGEANLNAGLTVSGGTTTLTALAASGAANLNAGLTVSGGTTTLAALTVSGIATLNAGLTVSGGTTTLAALTASGTTTLAALTATGNVQLGSDVNADTIEISATTTTRGNLNIGIAAVTNPAGGITTPAVTPNIRVFGDAFFNRNATLGTTPVGTPEVAATATTPLIPAVLANTVTLNAELTVYGAATFTRPLIANGDVTLGSASGDNISVLGSSSFVAPATFLGTLSVGRSTDTMGSTALNTYGAVTIGSSVTVSGVTTLDTDELTVNSPSTFNNTLTVNNLLTVDKGRLRGVPVDWFAAIPQARINLAGATGNTAVAFNNTANTGFFEGNSQLGSVTRGEVKRMTVKVSGVFTPNNAVTNSAETPFNASITIYPSLLSAPLGHDVTIIVINNGTRYFLTFNISVFFPTNSNLTTVLGTASTGLGQPAAGSILIGQATAVTSAGVAQTQTTLNVLMNRVDIVTTVEK